jgi:opacity protein-like surface antigen
MPWRPATLYRFPLRCLTALTALVSATASVADSAPVSPMLTVELAAAWQSRNTAQVSNEPPNTRFKIDELTGDGPFPAGRIVLDWPLSDRHRLRFLVAPLQVDETGTASQSIVFKDTTFAPGPIGVKYRFDSYRASYRYVFRDDEQWTLSVGATLNVRDAEIRLQQGALERAEKNTGVVPLLAFEGQWRFAPGWFGLLDFEGLAAPQGRAIDAALKLGYDVTPNVAVTAGYRFLDGGADNDDLYTFARFDSAVLGVTWKFR